MDSVKMDNGRKYIYPAQQCAIELSEIRTFLTQNRDFRPQA